MGYFFLVIFILALIGIAYLAWLFRKASKLDFVHYPDRGIDMCTLCQHKYPSWQLESDLQDLEEAARMNINLPADFWNRFCCDALRNKLKTKYREKAFASFTQILERSNQQTKNR